MRKKIITIASLCVAGMLLCACGTKNNKVETQTQTQQQTESEAATLADGEYTVNVTLEGGSGRATVDSEAKVKVTDGQAYATIVWSSTHYDYMLVDDQKYENENEGGNSTFTFPISMQDGCRG